VSIAAEPQARLKAGLGVLASAHSLGLSPATNFSPADSSAGPEPSAYHSGGRYLLTGVPGSGLPSPAAARLGFQAWNAMALPSGRCSTTRSRSAS
jgi:hypothetical protein